MNSVSLGSYHRWSDVVRFLGQATGYCDARSFGHREYS